MGFLNKIGSGFKKAVKSGVEAYQEWEGKAPERQKRELERLQKQEKKLSMQATIAQKKEKIRKLQKQAYGDNPFMSGGGMFGANPFQDQPVRKASSSKKKTGSKKPKRRVTEYY